MRPLSCLLAAGIAAMAAPGSGLAADEGPVLLPATQLIEPVVLPGYSRDDSRSTGHIGAIQGLSFNPRASTLLSVSRMELFVDLANGAYMRVNSCYDWCKVKPSSKFKFDAGIHEAAAFSADGSRIFIADQNVLRMWDPRADNTPLGEFKFPRRIKSLAPSPDGRSVAVGDHEGYVAVLDLGTGKIKELLEGKAEYSLTTTAWVATTLDGGTLVAASRKGLLLLDPLGRKPARTLTADPAYSPVVSSDGMLLAAAFEQTELRPGYLVPDVKGWSVKVWEVSTWKEARTLDYGGAAKPVYLAFGPSNRLAVAERGPSGNAITVLDPNTGIQHLSLKPGRDVTSLAMSRDGGLLAAGTEQEVLYYWKSLGLKEAYEMPLTASVWRDSAPVTEDQLAQELAGKLASMVAPAKGEFETSAEHEARAKEVQDARARLREEYDARIAALRRKAKEADEAADAQMNGLVEGWKRRREQARAKDYGVSLMGSWGAYDADQETFRVRVLGTEIPARVPREKAKTLDRTAAVQVEALVRYHDDKNARLVSARFLNAKTLEPIGEESGPAAASARPAGQAAPPKLRVAAISFEDDSGDGMLDAGESGKVKVRLRNEGKGAAYGVTLKLEASGADARALSVKDRTYAGTVAPGEEKTVEAPVAAAMTAVEGEAGLKAVLAESEGFDSEPVIIKFKTRPLQLPRLELAGVEIRDADGNRVLAKGKEAEVAVVVRNAGPGGARQVRARLASSDSQVKVYGESEVDVGSLAPGESKRASFSVAVTRRYDGPPSLPLSLSLREERPECGAKLGLDVVLGVEPSDIKVVRVAAVENAAAPAGESVDDVPTFAKRAFGPEDFGVVIGIERYRDLPRSEFSGRDARLVKEYLKALGIPERNIELLVDEKASLSALERTLGTWLSKRVKPASRVVVYYSGHGAPEPATGEAYLMPFDGEAEFLGDTAYPLERLKDRLARLPASEVMVVLDSCFSGAGGRSVLAKGARPLVMAKDAGSLPPNMALLSASEGAQISTSSSEKRHGILTYYLLKAVKDGSRDLASAFGVLKPLVEDEAKLSSNASQTPVLQPPPDTLKGRFRLVGAGD